MQPCAASASHRRRRDGTSNSAKTYEPNQWRELVKVALLASAFIGAYATGAALSPQCRRARDGTTTTATAAAAARDPPLRPTHLHHHCTTISGESTQET